MQSTAAASQSYTRLAASLSVESIGTGAARTTVGSDVARRKSTRQLWPVCSVSAQLERRQTVSSAAQARPFAFVAVHSIRELVLGRDRDPGCTRYFMAASYIFATYSQLTRWSMKALR